MKKADLHQPNQTIVSLILIVLAAGPLSNVVMAQVERNQGLELIEVTSERLPEAVSAAETGLIQDQSEALEEIVVIGDPTVRSLRGALRAAQDQVHELFNELNDDNQFDIHCYSETRTGTNISRRFCKPNYVDTTTAIEGQAYLNDLRDRFGGAQAPSIAIIRFKNGILREKLTALV